jgi:hypothetical protein
MLPVSGTYEYNVWVYVSNSKGCRLPDSGSINIMRGVMHTTVAFGGSPTLAYMNMVYVFNHIVRGFWKPVWCYA